MGVADGWLIIIIQKSVRRLYVTYILMPFILAISLFLTSSKLIWSLRKNQRSVIGIDVCINLWFISSLGSKGLFSTCLYPN